MRRTAILSIFFVALLFFAMQITPVFAQSGTGTVGNQPGVGTVGNQPGVGTVNPSSGPGTALVNPLNVSTICGLIQKILAFVLAIGSPIAALFLVYAGFLFVTARGNPAALSKAKKNIAYVFLGIFIFLGAWLLGQVIANTIKSLSPANAQSAGACS